MRAMAWALGLAVVAVVGPITAFAQEVDPASERSTAFRAVEGPVQESVSGGALLVGAYAVILTLLVLYVIRLGRMERRLSETLARVQRGLEKVGERTGGDAEH